jgi:hypothetical protein
MSKHPRRQLDRSAKAFAWDAMYHEAQPDDDNEDTQENYDLREKMDACLGVAIEEISKLRTGLASGGLQPELEENNVEITVEGGMVVEVDGLPVDWTFEITDKDCEFEGLE